MPPAVETLATLAAAFAAAAVLTGLMRKLARRLHLVSRERPDRWGAGRVPLLGGLAVALAFYLALIIFARPTPGVLAVGASSAVMLAAGLFDDVRNLPPLVKVLAAALAGGVAFAGGVYVDIFRPYLALPLTVLWFVGVTMVVNLLDNMDGLAAGVAAACGLILLMDTRAPYAEPQVGIMAAALAGSALGFLVWNFPPAKVFLGDAGSLFIGAVLAAVVISGTWKDASNFLVTLTVPVFVLGVPIFGAVFVSLARKSEGRPLARGGTDHVSHRLVRMGLSERKALLLLYLASIVFGALAFFLKHNVVTLLLTFLLVLAALAVLGRLLYTRTRDDGPPENP